MGELTNSFDSNAAPMESATNREIAAASAALERPRLSLGRWFLTIISDQKNSFPADSGDPVSFKCLFILAFKFSGITKHSPSLHTTVLKAPLCIIHPVNDTGVPFESFLHFRTELLRLNKKFEAHSTENINDVLTVLSPVLSFLNRRLR
jgi:hypothetical protein